jgi:hypothetical protein
MSKQNEEIQMVYQMVERQKEKLLQLSRGIIPYLTYEDILQPQDFPELEQNPEFRFEEGYLMGLESVYFALRAGLPR